MGLPYGENFIILSSTVLYDRPVWRTDRQSGDSICYLALKTKCGSLIIARYKEQNKPVNVVYFWQQAMLLLRRNE